MPITQKEDTPIKVRLFNKNDIPGLIDQHYLTFPTDRHYTKEQMHKILRKKLLENPVGLPIGAVAYLQNRLIGSYLTVPFRVKIGATVHSFYRPSEVMVHPDYRRRGIATKIYQSVIDEFDRQEKNFFTLGATNIATGKVHERFAARWGLCEYSHTEYWRLPLNNMGVQYSTHFPSIQRALLFSLNPIAKAFNRASIRKSEPSKKIKFRLISNIPANYNTFWDEASKNYKNIIVRDQPFLEWRFFNSAVPYLFFEARRDERLMGYYVLLARGKNLILIDFFMTDEKEIWDEAFQNILRYGRLNDFWFLDYMATSETAALFFPDQRKTLFQKKIFICGACGKFKDQNKAIFDGFKKSSDWYLTYNILDLA